MKVHLISIKVSVEGAAAALVEAEGAVGPNLGGETGGIGLKSLAERSSAHIERLHESILCIYTLALKAWMDRRWSEG